MCLLDSVEHWDGDMIVCSATSHIAPGNPLRNAHGLPVTAGIEYAAQSMAVHGALLARDDHPPTIGFLTNVRNVHWSEPRLDLIDVPLRIQATRISGNEINLLYDFSIHSQSRLLLWGRAGVMIKPPASSVLIPT